MKLKAIASCVLFVTALPSLAFAGTAGSGPNPYRDCGIGAAVFPKTPVGAVISNVIWDLGTTALTSATASPETCSGQNVTAATFILESYDSLAEETARGQGEHLIALMNILEIQEANRAKVINQLRNQMADVVANENYTQTDKVTKSSDYYNSLMSAITAA